MPGTLPTLRETGRGWGALACFLNLPDPHSGNRVCSHLQYSRLRRPLVSGSGTLPTTRPSGEPVVETQVHSTQEECVNSQPTWPLNHRAHIKILAAAAEEHLSEVKLLEMPFISMESAETEQKGRDGGVAG